MTKKSYKGMCKTISMYEEIRVFIQRKNRLKNTHAVEKKYNMNYHNLEFKQYKSQFRVLRLRNTVNHVKL